MGESTGGTGGVAGRASVSSADDSGGDGGSGVSSPGCTVDAVTTRKAIRVKATAVKMTRRRRCGFESRIAMSLSSMRQRRAIASVAAAAGIWGEIDRVISRR